MNNDKTDKLKIESAILCPIHETNDCVNFKKSFSTKQIIQQYKCFYNIDVEPYFHSIEEITQYICTETKYRFFYPPELIGSQKFYETLSKESKYYFPWKWENAVALKWISKDDWVLEVACGNGLFIRETSKKASQCVGFDITATHVKQDNLEILNCDYESFFKQNHSSFDVIIAFQFLEHIYNVNEFFSFVLKTLKPGGRLILGLPDNRSLIFKDEILNFPPHHIGWWTPESLRKTAYFFGMKVLYQKTEPLQTYHLERYAFLIGEILKDKFGLMGTIMGKIFYKMRYLIFRYCRGYIKGHTFITVLEK